MRQYARSARESILLNAIFIAYACARILECVPSPVPRMAIVALDVLSALAFALVHGGRRYGLRGILAFAAICAVVGNVVENLGIATGFPFGRYYFVELMGPKLFNVPVLLGLAYIGMGYVSWTLGQLIVGPGRRLFAVPLLAGCVMVTWDVAQDPVWSTVLDGWRWLDGGPWFGVPVSNYLGWLGTVFTIYMLFALYLRQRPAANQAGANGGGAIIFYLLCAAGNVLQVFARSGPAMVQDPTGRPWRTGDITAASALVSIFAMGGFAAAAWFRRKSPTGQATG